MTRPSFHQPQPSPGRGRIASGLKLPSRLITSLEISRRRRSPARPQTSALIPAGKARPGFRSASTGQREARLGHAAQPGGAEGRGPGRRGGRQGPRRGIRPRRLDRARREEAPCREGEVTSWRRRTQGPRSRTRTLRTAPGCGRVEEDIGAGREQHRHGFPQEGRQARRRGRFLRRLESPRSAAQGQAGWHHRPVNHDQEATHQGIARRLGYPRL